MNNLIEAINNYDTIESIRIIKINKDLNIEETDEYNRTPLHISCISQLSEISYFLIKSGASLYSKGENGNLPLHYSVLGNDLKIIKKINELNFNMELINFEGENALHLAIKEGYLDIVQYLIDKININLRDNKGNSYIHKISCYTEPEILNIILSNGENINSLNNQKENLLHILAKNQYFNLYLEKIFDIAIQNNININQLNIYNQTAYDIAINNNNSIFIKKINNL